MPLGLNAQSIKCSLQFNRTTTDTIVNIGMGGWAKIDNPVFAHPFCLKIRGF